jgi:hypothetical protein
VILDGVLGDEHALGDLPRIPSFHEMVDELALSARETERPTEHVDSLGARTLLKGYGDVVVARRPGAIQAELT